MDSAPSDYYATLGVASNATQQQIRDAYKRAALRTHPDRVPTTSPERPARTRKFQQINDAYYTLSDAGRRKDYDSARSFHFPESQSAGGGGADAGGNASGGFPWSSFGFGAKNEKEEEKASNEQFGGIFEEMLREEGMADEQAKPTGKFWSILGGVSGGTIGFIMANVPGALAGAVAGNRLGAVRDTKGKAVYTVFQELPQVDKARLLTDLATKVFAHAVGS